MSRSLFTSRHGGFSRNEYESFNLAKHVGDDAEVVESNRELLAKELGINRSNLFFLIYKSLMLMPCLLEEAG
jgi:polyphenol oxidase